MTNSSILTFAAALSRMLQDLKAGKITLPVSAVDYTDDTVVSQSQLKIGNKVVNYTYDGTTITLVN